MMQVHMCQHCGVTWEDDGELVVFCYQCVVEHQ